MSKKLHKKIESLIGEVLHEESALLACGLILTEAFDQAKEFGDVEKMIDIADRWMLLSKMLGGEELPEDEGVEFKAPIGFLSLPQEDEIKEDINDPERVDKSSGGIKVCKKSRKL